MLFVDIHPACELDVADSTGVVKDETCAEEEGRGRPQSRGRLDPRFRFPIMAESAGRQDQPKLESNECWVKRR